MNIMLATVSERKREIGIRRAVGAKKEHILIQFLAESSILTLAGGIIGICLGVFSMFFLSFFIPWESSITAEAIFIPLIISSLTGLCSGIYPAYSAANMDPILALRS
jgi:putative ABC transport system permease protein